MTKLAHVVNDYRTSLEVGALSGTRTNYIVYEAILERDLNKKSYYAQRSDQIVPITSEVFLERTIKLEAEL